MGSKTADPVSDEKTNEQKAVKEICAVIRKREKLSWYAFFNIRVGLRVSEEYEKGFNLGRIGDDSLATIKAWLITHEPDLAYGLHPELFPRSLKTQWQGLIESRGQYGHVHSRPFETGGLHEISAINPINTRLELGQDFTIEIEVLSCSPSLDHPAGGFSGF